MADLSNVIETLIENSSESDIRSQERHEEMMDKFDDMTMFLKDMIELQEDQILEDRDNKLDDDLKSKSRDNKNENIKVKRTGLPPLISGGLLAGALGAFTGLSAWLIGLVTVLHRWEQVKEGADKEIQSALSRLNGILAAPFVFKATIGKILSLSRAFAHSVNFHLSGFFHAITNPRVWGILSEGASNIGRILTQNSKILSSISKIISLALLPLKISLKPLFPAVKILSKTIGTIGNILKGITKLPIINLLPRMLGGALRFLGRISGIFTIVIALFDGARGAWKEYQNGGRGFSVFRAFFESAINGFLSLLGDIGEVVAWIAGAVLKVFGVSDEKITQVKSGITGAFNWIENTLSGIVKLFFDTLEFLSSFDWITIIKETIGTLIETVQLWFNSISNYMQAIKNILGAIFTLDNSKRMEKLIAARDNLTQIWEDVTDFFSKQMERLKNVLASIKKRLKNIPFIGKEETDKIVPPTNDNDFKPKKPPMYGYQRVDSARQAINDNLSISSVSAPVIQTNTSNVSTVASSQHLSIPSSSVNREDPHVYGIRGF